jgi:hypothetical protein
LPRSRHSKKHRRQRPTQPKSSSNPGQPSSVAQPMPQASTAIWSRMLEEIQKAQARDAKNPLKPGQASEFDRHRRSKIAAVEQITGRPLILYGSACTSPGKNVPGQMLMLDFSDKIGFRTVTEKIEPPNIDIPRSLWCNSSEASTRVFASSCHRSPRAPRRCS